MEIFLRDEAALVNRGIKKNASDIVKLTEYGI